MKVLLIHPPSSSEFIDKVFMHEPLALEYLGAGLKADGHLVALHDARLETDFESAFLALRPDIVALTGYTSQVPEVKRIAARLKALDPGIFVVIGGHHATVRPADFNDPAFDLIVIGEGVEALKEIAAALEAARSFEAVRGLAIPGKQMLFTEERPYGDLDLLPLPDRSLTSAHRDRYFSEWLKPLASVRTSLGCTGRCNFCALWSITGGKYLRRSPESVVEELRTIEEENVFFCDDESMCDIGRMDLLADLIGQAGIRKKYFLYARADTIVRHPELFAKWRDIGLVQVFVGMESFSDERLLKLKKGVTVEQQGRAVRILERLGVLMYASFLVDPAFEREDFRSLVGYIRKLKLRYASFSILTPLPGTEMEADRRAELLPYQPELYDFMHSVLPTKLHLADFYGEYADLYRKAIPLRHGLRTLALYGFRRILPQLRLLGRALEKIRNGHLDHRGAGGE